MSKTIEVVALDAQEFEEYRADFDTMKAAKAWVKETGKDPAFWDRRAESPGYHKKIVTIHLIVDGSIVQDWFPF